MPQPSTSPSDSVVGIDEKELRKLLQRFSEDELVEMLAAAEDIEYARENLGPQTKEELWWTFKERYGVELSRQAVCEGHSCQLDMVWEVYSFAVNRVLWVVDRGGGKTSLMAWTDDCQCVYYPGFKSYTIGPGRQQGERKYEHILPYVVEGGVIGGKELDHIARSTLTKTQHKSGSEMEIALGGTMDSANGPRVPRLHCDERELLDDKVRAQASGIPAGRQSRDGRYIPAQIVDTSTMKWAGGVVDRTIEAYQEAMQKGVRPQQEVRISCIFESAAENPACRCVPADIRGARLRELKLDTTSLCECDTYERGFILTEDPDEEPEPRTLEKVCQGRFFRSRGYKPFDDIITAFTDVDADTWDAERECSQPSREGAYIKGYSQLRHGIKGYEPRPEYGPIFTSTDWGGCYDDETEVLTERGWIKMVDATMEDRFASLDLDSELVSFIEPTGVVVQNHIGPMDRWRNKHIDLLVTPNHKMVVAPMRDYHARLGLVESRDVKVSSRMSKMSAGRVDARHDDFVLSGATMGRGKRHLEELPSITIKAEHWAAFLGLWMAEGHTHRGKTDDGRDRVTGQVGITHLNEANVDEITEMMSAYFSIRHYTKHGKPKGTTIIRDVRLFNHLAELGRAHSKRLPEYVKTWSPELLRIYFDWHLRGDGNRNRIYTSSKSLADDLQEIALYAGWAADISARERAETSKIGERQIKARYPEYTVHLLRQRNRPHVWHRGSQHPARSTDGDEDTMRKVACVTLSRNGTLYVRRNGKAVWCGNTDSHSHGWYQVLEQPVHVLAFKSGLPRVLFVETVVRFAEIYIAGVGDVQLGQMVLDRESEWRLRWPGWRVHERYCDVANMSGRLNWRDQLGMQAFSRVKKDFKQEVKMVRSRASGKFFVVDIPQCPRFDKAVRGWHQENGHEVHDDNSHPMAEFRYFESNYQVIERQKAKAQRSPQQHADPDRAEAEVGEDRPQGRPVVTYRGTWHRDEEIFEVGAAADSPLTAERAGDRVLGSRTRHRGDWRPESR